MPAVNASISITFTSQYTGNHRVYWRIQGSGDPFTLDPTLVYCASGNTCNASIDILVDFETCPTITFEGYLQPVCFEESPLEDFPPITSEYTQFPDVNFVPDPQINLYGVSCVGVSVSDVVVTDPGSGYTDGVYTNIPFVGGGGSNAEATVTVTGGSIPAVGGVVVTNSGTGYSTPPTLDISSIVHIPGTVATFTVNLDDCQTLVTNGGGQTSKDLFAGYSIGANLNVCSETDPTVENNDWFAVQLGPCVCESCVSVQAENTTGGPLDAWYYSCQTGELYTESVPASTTVILNAAGPLAGCDAIEVTADGEPGITITIVPCA